jgi:hypothetical protein
MRARAVDRSSTSVSNGRVGSITAYYDPARSRAYMCGVRSGDALVPPPPTRLHEVHAREQQEQIATAQDHGCVVLLCRPRKRATLETLVEHPEPALIPRQNCQPVAAPIAKEKQMARERIQIEAFTHQCGEAVNRPAQIRGAGRDVDPTSTTACRS